jgi:hypothetical protein
MFAMGICTIGKISIASKKYSISAVLSAMKPTVIKSILLPPTLLYARYETRPRNEAIVNPARCSMIW